MLPLVVQLSPATGQPRGGMFRRMKRGAAARNFAVRSGFVSGLTAAVVLMCMAGAQDAAAAKRAGSAAPLTLENAKPATVPPRPRVNAPAPPAAPRRFAAPKVTEPPPPPNIVAVRETPPPPMSVEAPSLPAAFASVPPSDPTKATPAAKAAPSQVPDAAPRKVPTEPQVASLPPSPAKTPVPPSADSLTVVFSGTDATLSAQDENVLATLAAYLRARPNARAQLRSYASATADPRDARRASLDRALAVRRRLGALGIRSARIDIRALGASGVGVDVSGRPSDRIDIDLINK